MTDDKLLDLAEHWEAHCNRYVHGKCSTRRCLFRGGWNGGAPDFLGATCEAHETGQILRSLANKETDR